VLSRNDGTISALRRWSTLLILMGAMLVSMVDRFALAGLLEPIRKDLALSDSQLGLLGGISFGLFYATMSIPLGYLADRWSRTRTIMLGVALWCLATAACGFATSFWPLLAARIFVGAGEAALAPAGYSLIRDLFPQKQLARAISAFQLGSVLGAGLAFIIVGYTYAPLLAGAAANIPVVGMLRPWQQTFLAVGSGGIVLVILLALVREPAAAAAREPRTSLQAAFAGDPVFYALLFAAMAGIVTLNYSFMSWVPAIMSREHGRSISTASTTYGLLVLICSAIGLLSGGWLADRLPKSRSGEAHCRIVLIAAVIILPVGLALPWADSWTDLLILLSVFHVAAGLPIGVVPALLQMRAPPGARSQVSAAYVLIINLCGLGLGPAAVGSLSHFMSARANGLRFAVAALAALASPLAAIAASALLKTAHRGRRTHSLAPRAES
jgi:MFS family permease